MDIDKRAWICIKDGPEEDAVCVWNESDAIKLIKKGYAVHCNFINLIPKMYITRVSVNNETKIMTIYE